jgi:hypothetical protein
MPRVTTLVVVIFVAMAILLPAWGQISGGAITITLPNLEVGQDRADPTKTHVVQFRLDNRTPSLHNCYVYVYDVNGNRTSVTFTDAIDGTNVVSDGSYFVSPWGSMLLTLTSSAPSSPITLKVISLQNADGLPNVVASATPLELDANGLPIPQLDANGLPIPSGDVLDPSTITQTGQSFGVGIDINAPGVDTNVTLLNQNVGTIANATLSVYDGYNTASSSRVPMATVQIPISPGSPISGTVSQLFVNSGLVTLVANPPKMGNGQAAPMIQQFFTITADEPISVMLSRTNLCSNGAALCATGTFAVPLANQ